jgi:hypothetical protein
LLLTAVAGVWISLSRADTGPFDPFITCGRDDGISTTCTGSTMVKGGGAFLRGSGGGSQELNIGGRNGPERERRKSTKSSTSFL